MPLRSLRPETEKCFGGHTTSDSARSLRVARLRSKREDNPDVLSAASRSRRIHFGAVEPLSFVFFLAVWLPARWAMILSLI